MTKGNKDSFSTGEIAQICQFPLDEFSVTVRARNALLRQSIETLHDLSMLSCNELKSVPGKTGIEKRIGSTETVWYHTETV